MIDTRSYQIPSPQPPWALRITRDDKLLPSWAPHHVALALKCTSATPWPQRATCRYTPAVLGATSEHQLWFWPPKNIQKLCIVLRGSCLAHEDATVSNHSKCCFAALFLVFSLFRKSRSWNLSEGLGVVAKIMAQNLVLFSNPLELQNWALQPQPWVHCSQKSSVISCIITPAWLKMSSTKQFQSHKAKLPLYRNVGQLKITFRT